MNSLPMRMLASLLLVCLPLALSSDDTLLSPGVLETKHSMTSSRGFYRLTMQQDCNLVLYKAPLHGAVWASNTYLAGTGCHADMQADGNLVVYDSSGAVKWASSSNGPTAAYELVVGDDGRLVIYNLQTGKSVWNTLPR